MGEHILLVVTGIVMLSALVSLGYANILGRQWRRHDSVTGETSDNDLKCWDGEI